jgi:hypothetical protein
VLFLKLFDKIYRTKPRVIQTILESTVREIEKPEFCASNMNHLEQLVSEWLQYNGYFVKSGVRVGKRKEGGFKGELDVVGLHIPNQHLIHVECSLEAESREKREKKFGPKFARGQEYVKTLFPKLALPTDLDQVVLLQSRVIAQDR